MTDIRMDQQELAATLAKMKRVLEYCGRLMEGPETAVRNLDGVIFDIEYLEGKMDRRSTVRRQAGKP